MDGKDTNEDHNQLRRRTPTKISSPRIRTIIPAPIDNLNSSSLDSKSLPTSGFRTIGSGGISRLVGSINWSLSPQSNIKPIKLEQLVYKGCALAANTPGLCTIILTLEPNRRCYSIYCRATDNDSTSLTITVYFADIYGVLVYDGDPKHLALEFALKSGISAAFDKIKKTFHLVESDDLINCTILRLVIPDPAPLLGRELTRQLGATEPKCIVKFHGGKLGSLDRFEKELRDNHGISPASAIDQFNRYSRSLSSSPIQNAKRSLETSSPDSLFSKDMEKNKSRLRKSPSKLVEVNICDDEASTPDTSVSCSPVSFRRSVRLQSNYSGVSVSSKEFSYIDPEFDENAKFLFSFPEGESDSVDITSYELERLNPGVWLNDNIIDFDLKYVYSQLSEDLKSRVHLFNSFFYRRLSSAPIPSAVEQAVERKIRKTGYDLVRTWTRKSNIFEKDFIVIPICENLHWFLAIICYPKQMLSIRGAALEINLDDKETVMSDYKYKTVILIFDSLGLTKGVKLFHVLNRLKMYLVHEANDKGYGDSSADLCTGFSVVVPRQNNFSDCGCFLLEYVERFLKGPPEKIFKQILETKDRPEGLSGWFSPSSASMRRITLQEIIKQLAADYETRALTRPKQLVEDRSSDVEEIIL